MDILSTPTLIVIFIFISCVISDTNVLDNEYKLLPPIFHIDPYYDKCLQENKEFCHIHIKLLPLDPKNVSNVWKIIEETKKSKEHFNHDELFYAICIKNNNTVTDISESYSNIGLKTEIIEFNCKSDEDLYKTTFYDIFILWSVISYVILIAIATLYDLFRKKNPNKYLILFSIRHNLVKIGETYEKMKGQKLKCIQGMRFYATFLMILGHTLCSYMVGYLANTEFLEDLPKNTLRRCLLNISVFLIQPFFLISGWLLSFHTFQIFEKSKQINGIKFTLLMFCHRYLRLIPLVLFMISLTSSVWIYGSFDGPVKDLYSDKEFQRCRKNWWTNLLFINNHYNEDDMCYPMSWQLAADFQLYTLSLILLIVMWKFKRYLKVIMAFSVLIGVAIPSVISYIYNLDIIYRVTAKKTRLEMLRSFEFNALHCATYASFGTYTVGLIFGYFYFKYGEKPLFTNRFGRLLWCIGFFGIPLVIMIIPNFEYNKITSAILAGILRPLYALGVGIGILGMSQKIGGLIRTIYEWKIAVFLGNLTYSTYLGQFLIIFYRTATTTKPFVITEYILLTSFIQDLVLSYIGGFLMHLLIEMPASQLQNLLMPKIKTYQSKVVDKKIK